MHYSDNEALWAQFSGDRVMLLESLRLSRRHKRLLSQLNILTLSQERMVICWLSIQWKDSSSSAKEVSTHTHARTHTPYSALAPPSKIISCHSFIFIAILFQQREKDPGSISKASHTLFVAQFEFTANRTANRFFLSRSFSLHLSLSLPHTHTHTHTH